MKEITEVLETHTSTNITDKQRKAHIDRIKSTIPTLASNRPIVAAHSGFGKTWLKKHTNKVLDIDDYHMKTQTFAGNPTGLIQKGIHPYQFIAMSSGAGKTHIVKNFNINGRFVDIDELTARAVKDGLVDAQVARLFATNTVNETTQRVIKTVILPRYIVAGKVYLIHTPLEMPDGGLLLDVITHPVFPKEVVERFRERARADPIAVPQDSWHNIESIMFTRRINCRYASPVTTRDQISMRFSRLFSGMRVTWTNPESLTGIVNLAIKVPVTNPVDRLPKPPIWQLFNEQKFAKTKPVLDAEFPNGWATRSSGKLLMVHSPNDAQRWGGQLVATLEYCGTADLKPFTEGNRQTNRNQVGEETILKSFDRQRDNARLIDIAWRRYVSKFSQDAWFQQFKLDKLEQGVIKTWDAETELYLNSDLHEWVKYQSTHDVLYQNWFMDEQAYKLKRFRPGEWNYHLAYWSDCMSVMKHINPKIYQFCLVLCLTYNLTFDVVNKAMKALSNMVKAFNNDWCSDWQQFIDLGRLQGFSLRYDEQAYLDSVKEWLFDTSMSKHNIDGSEGRFLYEFKQSVRAVLSEQAKRPEHTLDEFIDSPHLWAVSGSAKGLDAKPTMWVDGKLVKVKLTKRLVGFTVSHDDLKAAVVKPYDTVSLFEKIEPGGRRRPVANAGIGSYVDMSCMDDRIYSMVNPDMRNTSPIWKNFDAMNDWMWQVKHIGTHVCLPLDQTGFERQTSHEMLDIILDVMIERVHPDDSEAVSILQRIKKRIRNSTMYAPGTELHNKRITNGLVSGWKWTALLNTIINLAELLTMTRLADVPYHNLCALGDDTRVWLESFDHAERLLSTYVSCNIKMNEKLSIMSRTCDEFLRKVTELTDSGPVIHGYANRMLVSICYRNPKSREPADVLEAVETAVSNWHQLFSRLGDAAIVKALEPCLYQDVDAILQSYGVDAVDHSILHTPRSENGFGVTHLNPGGPSLSVEYNIESLQQQLHQRARHLLDNLIRKHKLIDQPYELDRKFTESFIGDVTQKKIKTYKTDRGYNYSEKRLLRRLRDQATATRNICQFGSELVTLLNRRSTVEMEDLPYKKGDFIPSAKGGMQSSGFFESIYDKTPTEYRRDLFSNPAVYDRCIRDFGQARTRMIIFKGIQWTDFRNWKYNTDFFNLITAQFTMYYLDKRYDRRISTPDLMLLLEVVVPQVMDQLNFTIRH
nr:RNA-dependent RNA polymerase [Rhizoctonia zeae megatotivirus 2]